MPLKWKNPEKVSSILILVKELIIRDGDRISFNSHGQNYDFDTLCELLHFQIANQSIATNAKRSFSMIHALTKCIEKNELTHERLLCEIKLITRLKHSEPNKKFRYFTTIHLHELLVPENIYFRNNKITFYTKRPSKYKLTDDQSSFSKRYYLSRGKPQNYFTCGLSVEAKNPHSAGLKADGIIDELRAYWNYAYNSKTYSQRSSGHVVLPTINKFVRGPFHYIFPLSGGTAESCYWWDPEYITSAAKSLSITMEDWKNIEQYRKRLVPRINSVPSSQKLIDCFTKYCLVLDKTNHDNILAGLWSVLEKLTQTQFDRYDTTIRRAAAIFENYRYHEDVLNVIRNERNKIVHSLTSSADQEWVTFRVKYYVETLLHFYVRMGPRLSTWEQICQLLDYPKDIDAINSRITVGKIAKRFRSPADPD